MPSIVIEPLSTNKCENLEPTFIKNVQVFANFFKEITLPTVSI